MATQEHPRSLITFQRQRFGPVLSSEEDRVPAYTAVGGDSEPSAVIVCGGDAAVALRSDEWLVRQADHDGVDTRVGFEREQCDTETRRNAVLRMLAAHDARSGRD